ncbi:hypothetical protein FK178_02360 [Antarcticibacterium arcticum]|uniref:Aerotolerance regulator N-terminal domain-containing protein n=1 Tax=Antarcticibacterium arcticum TaxID=2585771 RepID=A0A5B8YIG5_9FLAO|nr:hypothetical protein [Antarcticibacterium arcticum]QED36627.1 hypothetical protein FK178_02360 [Antarcticibacterium arcticum]
MINNVVFLNESWFLPILGAAILLLVVFLWKEWTLAGKHRFIIKSTLVFIAVISLVLVVLKPAIHIPKKGGNIALLTPGYAKAQLDSLKKAERGLKLFNYEAGNPLPSQVSSSKKVFVLGYGLKEFDLWQMDGIPALYLNTELPEGVIKLNYKVENSVGDDLVVQGLYKNPKGGYRLLLEGPGETGLDSVELNGENEQAFKMLVPLKAKGNYIYSLTEKDEEGRIIKKDILPVKVAEKEELRILILNAFPTFETRYLKNFLAEAGHELVVRSQITRNRFKFEYLNTDRIGIGRLTEEILEPFDLLIADASSLRGFSGSERNVIGNMVREQGLGVFIQPDDTYFSSRGQLNILSFINFPNTEINDLQWPSIKLNAYPYRIKKEFGIREIHAPGNSIAAAYKKMGEGKIGTAVYSDTWELLLEGNDQAYRQIWSKLIEEVSRKEFSTASWNTVAISGQIDEPFEFELRTEIEDPFVTTGGGSNIPLIQDTSIPYLWRGTTWPRESGWNILHLDTISTYHFYVEDGLQGTTRDDVQILQANKRYFNAEIVEGQGYSPLEPVNPLWFFGLFLICMGGLWLEPKL